MGKRGIKLIYEKDSNKNDDLKTYSLSVLVDNEAGALARVVGMFSARGYNIDSLTVAQVETDENLSRITITTSSTDRVIDQIKAQLEKMLVREKRMDLFKRCISFLDTRIELDQNGFKFDIFEH